jgi:hypothetical protein
MTLEELSKELKRIEDEDANVLENTVMAWCDCYPG